MSLVLKGRSSCRLTPLDEEEANVVRLVDNITDPKAIKLYMP